MNRPIRTICIGLVSISDNDFLDLKSSLTSRVSANTTLRHLGTSKISIFYSLRFLSALLDFHPNRHASKKRKISVLSWAVSPILLHVDNTGALGKYLASRWEPAVAVREENHHILLAGHLLAALLDGEKALCLWGIICLCVKTLPDCQKGTRLALL